MTDDQKEKGESSKNSRVSEILFYSGTIVLFFVFRYGFQFSGPLSIFSAIVVDFIVIYAVFVRGKENVWRKDKRPWTFITWLIPTFVIATGFYVAYWISEPYYPW